MGIKDTHKFFLQKHLVIVLFLLFSFLISQNGEAQDSAKKSIGFDINSKAAVLKEEAAFEEKNSNYTKAIKLYIRAIEEDGNAREKAIILNRIGRIYTYLGNYDEALHYYAQALDLSKKHADSMHIALVLNNIGIVHNKIGNTNKALKYFQQSLKIKQYLGENQASTINNIGNLYWRTGEFGKSLMEYKKSYQIAFDHLDSNEMAISLNNIGLCYGRTHDFEQAIAYYEKSLILKEKQHEKLGVAITYNNMAFCYRQMNKLYEALSYSKKSLEIAENIGAREQIINSLHSISLNYALLQDFQQAYHFQLLFKEMSDSVFNLESENKIAEIESRFQLKEKEQIIQSLEKEKKLRSFVQISLIIGLLFIILLSVVIFYSYRLQIKNTKQKLKIARETRKINKLTIEKNSLQIEKQNSENELLKSELEYKRRALTSKTMALVKNSEANIQLLKNINELKPFITKDGELIISQIIDSRRQEKNDFNWLEFEKYFQEVHQKFYRELHRQFPDLTVNERKLCAFLRLNLSTKEIATITFKSPNTIVTSRKRLRKSLCLTAEQNLISFLNTLG